jgi:hypothetical protein
MSSFSPRGVALHLGREARAVVGHHPDRQAKQHDRQHDGGRQGQGLGKAGTRAISTRAKLSIITARNTARANGVRMSRAQYSVAPPAITARNTTALRVATDGETVIQKLLENVTL